ncbi:hypothetical protein [Halobellus litoreus]|uniref:Uncharacterized protein n=1 Tax=Halobellus litoreus TaxID=755310 RepID=A0ABD6E4L6_9EURY|nr:hypothetical protein [Halobellus litoreus]
MVPTRRQLLQVTGTVSLTALAGCSAANVLDGEEPTEEYTLHIDAVNTSPTEYALYQPDDESLFGTPARTALQAIVPEGRHTTYGYKPLPSDAYVEHDGSYFQTKHVVTGQERVERSLVQVTPISEENVPEDAILIDALEQPSARVLKILHSYTQTGGRTSTAELLRGDQYVLRRPAEQESPLGTGELDGQVVTMTEDGTWAYRVHVTTERIVETAYTALAVNVASSRQQFRDVVFGSRIDATLTADELPTDARDRLDQTINRGSSSETAPLPDSFVTLLKALHLGAVNTATNGKLLWYDDALYRYGLYVNDAS